MADAPEFDPSKPFEPVKAAAPEFDPSQPHEVKRQNTTVMDYPQIYEEMRKESQGQMARGVEQLGAPTGGDLWESGKAAVKGIGNVGLGALGYVGSPIAAGIRAVVGEPLEQRTGVPKEYSEFATSLAIPGVGLPRIPGSTAPNVATKTTGPRTGKIADETRLLTEGGQQTQAGLALREAATDPEAARRALGNVDEIIPGSQPTTFQASGDYGLGQLERGVQTKAQAPFVARRAEQAGARQTALESVERPGNPEEVANFLRGRMQANDAAAEAAELAAVARAEQETLAAVRRAERAGQVAGGTNTPEIYGQIIRRELDEANSAARTNERTLWQGVDPDNRFSVSTRPVMNAEFRIYRDEMTQAGAASLTDVERTIGGVIQRYGQAVPFREMQDLRSFVSSAMRQELRANGNSPAYARLTRLRGAIEESVSAPYEPGIPITNPGQAALSAEAAERLAEATAATRARAETFKQQPIKGVLQREGVAGPYPLTNAAVPGRIIPDGPKGYDYVNSYLRAVQGRPGGGLQEIRDAMVADMRAHVTDVNGNLDPGRLMSWARSKQDALRAVTERDGGALARQLEEIQQSGFGVKAATKEQARTVKEAAATRAAVGKTENEGIFGDLMGVRDKEDISKLLGSIFGSKTAVTDARELMARLGTPEAQDGARRAITDWITNKLVSNTAAGTTQINILRADQFQQFIKQNVAVLNEFGFVPEQIRTWQAIAADMRRAKMSIDATKVPGGSNTAQDLYAMKKFGLQGSKLSKILHVAGAGLGGVTGGWVGAVVGLFGAGKYSALRDAGIKSVQDLIVQGMLDPALGRELLTRVTPRENIAFWQTMGIYGKRAVRAEALTGSRHDQPEPSPKGYAYGGTVFPVGREGIKTRNKARAFEARERSTLARSTAQAKRKVKYADGGLTKGAEGDITDASGFLSDHPTVSAMERMHQTRKRAQGIDQPPPPPRVDTAQTHTPPRFAEGGGVDVDSSEPDPLDAELKRRKVPGGLNATAGPTVTSTTPVQDIPAPKVNAAGETLPTYVFKEMGKQLLGTPERMTRAGGDLQRRGEYAGSHEDLPSFGPPPEEMPAGLEAGLMLYGANAPFVQPGSFGIFGGKGAKTANLPKLAEAERMLKEGVPHETIRNQTGWEFGPEGKPRFEISDAESRIKPEHPDDRIPSDTAASRPTGLTHRTLEETIEHPAFFEAYPQLKGTPVRMDVSETTKPGGGYAPPTKYSLRGSPGDIEVYAPTYEKGGVGDLFGEQKYKDTGAREILLHEMQHAVQQQEGFAPGANPRQLPMTQSDVKVLTQRLAEKEGVDWNKLGPDEKTKLERIIRHRIYRAHSGETEARNVQTRADDVLRQRPSWKTEDVARQHQVIENTPKERKTAGGKPFKDAKIYKAELEPEVGPVPGSKEWRDAPNPSAPFPQYATEYPPVGPPKMKPKDKPSFPGETYPAKQLTPDAKAFQKGRARIIKEMDEQGYHPYFDPEKRFDVDPKNYPLNIDTTQIVPKTPEKLLEHLKKTGAAATRAALQRAYKAGVKLGTPDTPGGRLTTQDWYMMGQLEAELVQRMGAKAGREAFKQKFATAMGATTGGMKPRDNLIASGYMNYLAAKGQRWPEGHQWPFPVGARYGEQLGKTAQRVSDEGGFKSLGVDNPKRHNFAGNFMGHRKLGTMDEQMTDLMQPGKTQPDWYGINERVMAEEAKKAKVDPRKFQETGWAGHKGEAGGPMIQEVNHTIERIHRLTGMPRSEIVYRVWGKGDIPVYGTAMVAGLKALRELEDQYSTEE